MSSQAIHDYIMLLMIIESNLDVVVVVLVLVIIKTWYRRDFQIAAIIHAHIILVEVLILRLSWFHCSRRRTSICIQYNINVHKKRHYNTFNTIDSIIYMVLTFLGYTDVCEGRVQYCNTTVPGNLLLMLVLLLVDTVFVY
jgi:hypothetical protein